MTLSVNVTVSMQMEMVDSIEEEAERLGMSRAEYIRHCVRQAEDSPFECPDTVLCTDENHESSENAEGAA